jgi:hypothetical protein
MPTPSLHPPEEQQIEDLLRKFHPRPGKRFYRRMQSAPWRQPALGWGRRRLVSVGLALLVVIAIGLFTSPGLYALGEQLWRFFLPEQGNHLVIPLDTPGVIVSGDLSGAQDFPLSQAGAEDEAGYAVKTVPVGGDLELEGMRYEAVTLTVRSFYRAEAYNLYLSQRPLSGIREQAAVGPAAAIEAVIVGGLPGEYVSGGWRLPEGATISPEQAAQAGSQLDLTWDASMAQRTLRWQDGEYAYELRVLGSAAPEKQGLITMAERLK